MNSDRTTEMSQEVAAVVSVVVQSTRFAGGDLDVRDASGETVVYQHNA